MGEEVGKGDSGYLSDSRRGLIRMHGKKGIEQIFSLHNRRFGEKGRGVGRTLLCAPGLEAGRMRHRPPPGGNQKKGKSKRRVRRGRTTVTIFLFQTLQSVRRMEPVRYAAVAKRKERGIDGAVRNRKKHDLIIYSLPVEIYAPETREWSGELLNGEMVKGRGNVWSLCAGINFSESGGTRGTGIDRRGTLGGTERGKAERRTIERKNTLGNSNYQVLGMRKKPNLMVETSGLMVNIGRREKRGKPNRMG